jgi:hypothetical protein
MVGCNIKNPYRNCEPFPLVFKWNSKKKHLQNLPGDAPTDDDAPGFILFSLCVFRFQFYR